MPLDTQLTLYNAVWALLEGSTPFTTLVKDGNRMKSTDFGMALKDETKSKAAGPADFPKVRIEVAEEIDGERVPQTFCAITNRGIPMTSNMEIVILHDSLSLQDQTPVEAAIRGALYSAGLKLGIQWVSSFVVRGTKRSTERSALTGGSLRTISRMRLVVSARPMMVDLNT